MIENRTSFLRFTASDHVGKHLMGKGFPAWRYKIAHILSNNYSTGMAVEGEHLIQGEAANSVGDRKL